MISRNEEDEVIMFYKSCLSIASQPDEPIGQLSIGDKNYYYPSQLGSHLQSGEYFYQIARLVIPKSFKLYVFDFNSRSKQLTNELLIPIERAYKGDDQSHFIVNIRTADQLKDTYQFNEETKKFDPSNEESFVNASVRAWDYKREGEEEAEACGTRCRETLLYGRNPHKLLVFYSEEKAIDGKFYYVPCLGKVECGQRKAADVVYFNTNKTDLIDNWLYPVMSTDIKTVPGIADALEPGFHPEEDFGEGTDEVSIRCTDDPDILKISKGCEPVDKVCL